MLAYGTVLAVGITLLATTIVRVLVGGITDSSARVAKGPTGSHQSARQILEERYAAGELSQEQLQHMLAVLEGRV